MVNEEEGEEEEKEEEVKGEIEETKVGRKQEGTR